MIRHIVCFKLLDNSEEKKLVAKETLLSMVGNVPMLREIEVGMDFLATHRSYDIVLITTFDSPEDLNDYQVDPYHVSVVKKYMHSVVETSVAVDYKI